MLDCPHRRLWLCLPAVLICALDQILTLAGQPASYWSGSFHDAQEGAPHGLILLTMHPTAYIVAALGYILVFCAFILWLPGRLARILATGLVIGHCWGASWWVFHFTTPPWGYWMSLALFGLAAVLLVLGLEWSEPPVRARSAGSDTPSASSCR
jgi:hypothetical protein